MSEKIGKGQSTYYVTTDKPIACKTCELCGHPGVMIIYRPSSSGLVAYDAETSNRHKHLKLIENRVLPNEEQLVLITEMNRLAELSTYFTTQLAAIVPELKNFADAAHYIRTCYLGKYQFELKNYGLDF